jgi:two-component system, OmpR family, phosphate regulon sensor histidine kinase PhoR
MPSRLPLRRLLAAACLLVLPSVVALGGLMVFAGLSLTAAFLAALVVLTGLALLLRPHLAHLTSLARYAGEQAAGRRASAPVAGPFALDRQLGLRLADSLSGWRERENELSAHAALIDRVLGQLPDPLLLVDAEKRLRLANDAAEELYGNTTVGRDLVSLIRQPELLEAVDRVLAGSAAETIEFTIPVPVERSFDAHILPLSGAAGDEPTALLLLQDMTKVMRADRLRADFVANASHELRTPLATLVGFIETLQGPAKDDDDARARFLAIMQEQAARMARLVADLLSLSRIELNEHSVPTETARIDGVLFSVADSLTMRAGARNMTIQLPGDLAQLPPVQADNDELVQLFQNLIDNAIKYGRSGTAVRVLARRSDPPAAMTPARPAIAISVVDQGEGIARQDLPRLTERFYRVDKARSRDLGGTGLGLAIVKHIVSRHRGALEIESEPGQGSRFTVYLPLAEAAQTG